MSMDTHPRLTIRDIRARAVDLAPQRPMETAAGALTSTPLVLIDLLTEEGVTGVSYVRCYAPVALGPLALLVANLAPLLTGATAAPCAVEQTLQRHFRLLGPQGLTGIAMAGIDMALWDARAKACGADPGLRQPAHDEPQRRRRGGRADAHPGLHGAQGQGRAR